ncbi:hypothetical protein NLX66_013115 [Acinetobacter baumannii]|nr:hypothetical protein [Acinetobacter baumannii]
MDTQELKTLIPLLAPFLTVFLGILAIPFIEVYKNYIEKKVIKLFIGRIMNRTGFVGDSVF